MIKSEARRKAQEVLLTFLENMEYWPELSEYSDLSDEEIDLVNTYVNKMSDAIRKTYRLDQI